MVKTLEAASLRPRKLWIADVPAVPAPPTTTVMRLPATGIEGWGGRHTSKGIWKQEYGSVQFNLCDQLTKKMRAALAACAALAVTVEARHKKLNAAMPPIARAGVGSPCDAVIPGDWTGSFPPAPPLNDLYSLAWTQPPSPGAWTATMVQGGGWSTGVGQFSPDNRTATIAFDSGVKLTGNGELARGGSSVKSWVACDSMSLATRPP